MTQAVPQQFISDDNDFDQQIPVSGRSTKTTATAPAAAKPAPAPVEAAGEELSFDDENLADAVKASDGLTTLKINKGETARFSFVPGVKIRRAPVHYVEGTGSIQCLSTKENPNQVCCRSKAAGLAKDRYVGLIFRYTNVDPKTGKFPQGVTAPAVEVQAVRMSRSNMRDILDSVEDGESVYGIDLRMKHDESRAFGYKFSKAGSKASWKHIEKEALALAVPFLDGVKLSTRLGKKLDAIQLNAILSTGVNNESMEKMLAAMESED
jgi:hypothetical protein